MSFEGRVWTYTQISAPVAGHHLLTTVAPPVGPSWTFQSNTTVVPRCELTGVTTPQGGQIAYQFAEKTLSMANQLLKFRTLTNRLANGRDLQAGSWLYAYAQGPDQNKSIVSGPNGVTTTHTFFGIGNTHYQPSIGAWKVGLPSSMAISDSSGTLQTQNMEWTPSVGISRDINPDGTVAWERRRGFTTYYQYDDLQRLTRVTPPRGHPTIVGYDNTGGTYTTSSRGPSSTTTYLDGFGRVSGTVNNVGVRTDITIDALGRPTYESYPYDSNNIGTTLTYDGLSRVVRRTHPDQTWIGYTFYGIDVTIRDENGRNTQQAWSAFGDPDEKRLTSVTADQQTTTYTYNTVGSLRTVQGFGQTRTWVYNTKNQPRRRAPWPSACR